MSGRMSKNKGKRGEQEVCKMLNSVYVDVLEELHLPIPADVDLPFQRNQNQSAVGGDDIACPFPLSIEVKFAETLQVDKWWEQCLESAKRQSFKAGIPHKELLLYRKSRQKWSAVMYGSIRVSNSSVYTTEVTLDEQNFREWFHTYIRDQLK